VALAEAGKRTEVREYGKIANSREGVGCDVVTQWPRAAVLLRGWILRLLPRRPGERIKTDRQDVINLAKLDRAGELTPVGVPDQAHEVIRDLVRAAVDPMADDLALLGLDMLVGEAEYQRHAPNPLVIVADH
jgi:hypothetical protein